MQRGKINLADKHREFNNYLLECYVMMAPLGLAGNWGRAAEGGSVEGEKVRGASGRGF